MRRAGFCAFVELPLVVLIVASYIGGVALLLPRVGWPSLLYALACPATIYGLIWLFLRRADPRR